MKKILSAILGLFDIRTAAGQRNIALVVAIVAILLVLRSCGGSNIEQEHYEQNLNALTDSVRSYKSKNNSLIFEKSALITDVKTIGKLNEELAVESKKLKDRIITISKIGIKIERDTVFLEPVLDDITFNNDSTTKTLKFNWNDSVHYDLKNYRILAGNYVFTVDTGLNVTDNKLAITDDVIGMSFTTGLTETKDGKNLEIFITSDYPGFTVASIDGALIDPRNSKVIKKHFPNKRWSVGPYVGYGVYMDPQRVQFGHGVQIGVALHYAVFQWGAIKK